MLPTLLPAPWGVLAGRPSWVDARALGRVLAGRAEGRAAAAAASSVVRLLVFVPVIFNPAGCWVLHQMPRMTLHRIIQLGVLLLQPSGIGRALRR